MSSRFEAPVCVQDQKRYIVELQRVMTADRFVLLC